ncbi:AfsR/SARP family transcriptional regulator [Saccharothrix yanglingensis]|nr:BTAD domain-containing putative transcriptional regulator [Saccharothrix yanglingensis]
MPVLIGLLGPLALRVNGREVPLGPPRRRAVLGYLACRAGSTTTRHDVVDAVWGERAPTSVVGNLHTHVSELRRALGTGADDGARGLLRTVGSGYLLDVPEDAVDALRFQRLLGEADRAGRDGERSRALDTWRAAFALWRGTPLADVDAPYAEAERTRLDRLRVVAAERFTEALLASGERAEALAVVTPVSDEHPLDQRLAALRVRALAAGERRGEAAAHFRRTRDLVIAELGIDPDPVLRRAHAELLVAERVPATDRTAVTRLPDAPAGFTGRETELRTLEDRCARAGHERLTVCVVGGPPAVGKTSFALRLAHRVRGHFPDGAHFLPMDGSAAGLGPREAILAVLDAVGGGPDPVPDDLDELVGAYRSRLAGRKVLLVLDDARGVGQIRPLLPTGSGSMVLVTSGSRLSGLSARDGALRVSLGPLPDDEALGLIGALIGEPRDDAERAAVTELVGLCAGHPLALRLAAEGVLAARPCGLPDFLSGLRDGRNGLRVLDAVRAGGGLIKALTRPLRDLGPDPAELLALLSAQPCTTLTAPAAAALAGWEVLRTRRALDALADGYLADWGPRGRYRLEGWSRCYSALHAEGAFTDDVPRQAELRLVAWYARAVRVARSLVDGRAPTGDDADAVPFAGPAEALDWSTLERDNLVLLARRAAELGAEDAARALERGVR